MNKHKILVLVLLIFILMGAVSASENVTDTSTNNDAVTGDVLASPDNSQASSVADSNNNNNNVGNVTNVTKNNNSNLLSSPNAGGNVLNAPDDSFTALQAIINGVPSGSTVTLDKNYKFYAGDDSAYVNGITINKALTINGNGYTIDGSNSARIFYLTAGVTFNNITFVNALSDNGGAINLIDTNLVIKNSEFDIRTTDQYGSNGLQDWTRNGRAVHIDSEGNAYFGSTRDVNPGPNNLYQVVNFDSINSITLSFRMFEYSTFKVYAGNTLLYSKKHRSGGDTYTVELNCSNIKGSQTLLFSETFTGPTDENYGVWSPYIM